jgi:Gpi18-like mannosyltransferase
LPSIGVLLLAGLALRLVIAYVLLPNEGLGSDLRLFEQWAITLAQHGPGGFYANAGFADYTPGYLWVLWPMGLFAQAFGSLTGQAPESVMAAIVKVPGILGDMAVAWLLYRAASRWWGERTGRIAAAIFLFNPVTWYLSALWGQVDVVGSLVILAAVLLLIDGWSEAAVAAAVLATLVKPQYGLIDVVVGVILLRRHLIRPGSGPTPTTHGWSARLNERVGRFFTDRQGPIRLVSSALVGLVIALAVAMPFDLPFLASGPVAGVPVLDHVAGLLAIVGNAATYYNVLTANAFNFWALVGPTPLSHALSNDYQWTYDSLPVIAGISAATIGVLLLGATVVLCIIQLLRRDDRMSILIATTVMAVGFFALPTRVHERYLFPAFVIGALLAASSIRWRWWYALLAAANFVNLHAILTQPYEGYGTLTVQRLLFGRLFRTDPFVIGAAVAHTLLFLWALWQLRPALDPVARLVASWGQKLRPGAATQPTTPGPTVEPTPGLAAAAIDDAEGTTAAMAAPDATEVPAAPDAAAPKTPWFAPVAGLFRPFTDATRARLHRPPIWPDHSAELDVEGRGHLDRRDALLVAGLFVVVLGVRTVNLGQPRTMYFDEDYHARTAMEFLQDWRYGLPHDIYEWTHPHLAKYVIAAGLVALGDNTVTSTVDLGRPVRSAAVEPRYVGLPNESTSGDLLFVATGDGVDVVGLGAGGGGNVTLYAPGAGALAVDPQTPMLYVGTDGGDIFAVNTAPLEGPAPAQPTSRHLANVGGQVTRLWTGAPGVVVAQVGTDSLVAVDAATGEVSAPVSIPGVTAAQPFTVNDRPLIALTSSAGASVLDGRTLASVAQLPVGGPATGITYVDGNDYEMRARDLLPLPVLYVANGTSTVQPFEVDSETAYTSLGAFAMPGPVSDLRWNETTNLLHVLGKTAAGQPTVYVVDPHGNETFADARLPFAPSTWLLDTSPQSPDVDRERAIVLTADGNLATVDIGSNSFAWRFPGVLAGAGMAACLYLLTRLLFRRRTVAVFAGLVVLLDGMLYAQSRIAMNDTYAGFFIVAAYTVLAYLLIRDREGHRSRRALLLGLPTLGILLGLALASKWVGAYAIGGVVLIVLAQSALGRVLALLGMVGLTGALGFLALTDHPPNVTFFALMVFLTAAMAVMFVRRPIPFTRAEVRYAARGPVVLALVTVIALVVLAALGVQGGLTSIRVGPVGAPLVVLLAVGLIGIAAVAAVSFEALRRLGFGPDAALGITASDADLPADILATDDAGQVVALADAGGPAVVPAAAPEPVPTPQRGWTQPGWSRGGPFTWALVCLTLLPLAVYVLSYVPWALSAAGGPQLFPGWPPGHTGQTFLDLQAQMYKYHNELRAPHGASSPWWAWPLDLKPIWGYLDSYAGNTEETIFGTGNLVLFWMAIPAAIFGTWMAWRRRSFALAFVVVAMLCQWLPWSRIDRVAFQYHFYTTLPFLFILLAYFLAELWHGAAFRTWTFARVAAFVVALGPGLLWLFRGPVCAAAGVSATTSPDVCGGTAPSPVPAIVYLAIVGAVGWWAILGARDARRFVLGVFVAAAGFFFAFLAPLGSFAMPAGWAESVQRLIPTWPVSFQFSSNTQAPAEVSILSLPALLLTVAIGAVALIALAQTSADMGRPVPWATVTAGVAARWRRPTPAEGPTDTAATSEPAETDEPDGATPVVDAVTDVAPAAPTPAAAQPPRRLVDRVRSAYDAVGRSMARPEDAPRDPPRP